MMNQHHMPAGQGHQYYPSGPHMHPHHSQRPREFHPYHVAPQSPMHQYQYSPQYHPHPQQYYHPSVQPYPQQIRWQQHQQQQQQQQQQQHQQQQHPPQHHVHPPYAQHYMQQPHSPGHHMPYQQRSPMVVSSQPSYNAQQSTPTSRYPPSNPPFYPQNPLPHRSSFANSSTSPVHSQQTEIAQPQRVEQLSEAVRSPSILTSQSQGDTIYTPSSRSQSVVVDDETVDDVEELYTKDGIAAQSKQPSPVNPLQASPILKTPFYPELPWYSPSASASNFPPRDPVRRKRRSALAISNDAVTLPSRSVDTESDELVPRTPETSKQAATAAADLVTDESVLTARSDAATSATSLATSESDCATNVSTPTTPAQLPDAPPKLTPTQSAQAPRRDPRSVVAVPFIPAVPKAKATSISVDNQQLQQSSEEVVQAAHEEATDSVQDAQAAETEAVPPPKPAPPKSWADLVRKKEVPGSVSSSNNLSNGVVGVQKNATLAEALRQYVVQPGRVAFFEPKGLVNTGNMCYMNSILQVLVFCVPFYDFLDQVRSRTVHSIKSDTPLLDAIIMFMRELQVLASAPDVAALRKVLKPEQLEKYGEPITPEYIYDALKHLPRFQSMRRGHQQDAEEFLGFVLEGLHDECLAVMQSEESSRALVSDDTGKSEQTETDGWLEVGPKQKAAVTRTAGQQDAPSPVTKIFGGHLRSELRVSGQKDSVTLEPYKPLQLDIGASHIHNIVDAIKSITRPESLTGDFGGRANTAKKQVFIDSLPPVLILHLKRFQYENNLTGTQKIWKKVGYPLELEIPKDVFSPSKRGGLTINGGLPKYRLTSVVYHHGKSAAGGHYTVDVLRQDLREWVRIDDTIIRRIRPEEVAEGGAEEDPKILARALEQHKAAQELQKQRNMYEGLDDADVQPDEHTRPWSEVNGSAEKKSKLTTTTAPAGSSTPASTAGKRTPNARKEGVRDNKVAYILLYERI